MRKDYLPETDFYRTSDLPLATVLSLYYPLEAVDKTNSRRAFFIFKRDTKLDEIIEKYYRRELKVEPATFFERLAFIKSRLYAEENL
jgi:hypothetical protein